MNGESNLNASKTDLREFLFDEELHSKTCYAQVFHDVIIKVYLNCSQTPYQQILDLIQHSFKERLQQGINFTCSSYTLEQFRNDSLNDIIITAESMDGVLLGTVTITPQKKYGHRYAYHKHLAVSNSFKKKGIGTKLEKFVEKLALVYDVDFLTSSTATLATSSVLFHKRNGFLKRKFVTYETANYDSFEFIKPIKRTPIVIALLISRIPCFGLTYAKTRMFKLKRCFCTWLNRNKCI